MQVVALAASLPGEGHGEHAVYLCIKRTEGMPLVHLVPNTEAARAAFRDVRSRTHFWLAQHAKGSITGYAFAQVGAPARSCLLQVSFSMPDLCA